VGLAARLLAAIAVYFMTHIRAKINTCRLAIPAIRASGRVAITPDADVILFRGGDDHMPLHYDISILVERAEIGGPCTARDNNRKAGCVEHDGGVGWITNDD
jgi:hypothetical protein